MPSKLEELKAKAQARRNALAANLGLDSAAQVTDNTAPYLSDWVIQYQLGGKSMIIQLTEALHSKSERKKLLDEKNEIENKTKSDKKVKSEKTEKTKSDEYTDSSTFLKGTNSNNPHNDYCQNFIDTGQV